MPDDDPAFSKTIRAMRDSRPYSFKTVGEAIDFVTCDLKELVMERPHWGQARWVLYEALPDDATGMPRPGADKIEAAEDAFQAALKIEGWLVEPPPPPPY
jgi:hypothetical protein